LTIDSVETANVIIITGIDKTETAPLAGDINEFTRGRFTDEKWLNDEEDRKGSKDIRLGLLLPPMPFPY
jgi:ribosomal protein L6P/L9E